MLRTSSVTLPELERLEGRAALPDELRELERELPRLSREIQRTTEHARSEIREATRWFDAVDIEYGIRVRSARLTTEKRRIDAHVARAADAARQVEAVLAEAERASEEAMTLQMDSKVRAELRRIVAEAKLTRLSIRRAEASTLRLQAAYGNAIEELDQVLESAASEGPSLSRDLMRRGPSPFQTLSALRTGPTLREAALAAAAEHVGSLAAFLRSSGQRVFGQVCSGLAVLLALRWLRTRARRQPERSVRADRGDPLLHPLAAAVLVTTTASSLIHAEYPAAAVVLAAAVTALSGLRLTRGGDPGLGRWQRLVFYVLLLLEVCRLLVFDRLEAGNLLLLAEGTLGGAAVAWALRSERRQIPGRLGMGSRVRWLVASGWVAAFGVGVVVLAAGLVHTGTTLISGATTSLLAAVVWDAMYRVLVGVTRVVAEDPARQQSARSIARASWVAQRLRIAIAATFAYFWLKDTLRSLTLWEPTVQVAKAAFAFSAEIGSIKLSVGSLATLVVGVFLAVYLAKAVRSVLDEDVLSRTTLVKGTRAATSASAYYGVLVCGVFLSVGAAGVELEKLTIIAGALGVGIGFGLQNIVQNFVAGLILVFGRPVNVDDRIQIGELVGIVRQIGFRASTIRTFQGADVIVPNSDLISTQVINWTLSDPDRRLDIDVGVAYGTDPGQVLDLLLMVARSNPSVVADPAPEALFLAHGESSLDFQLRVWTRDVQRWPNVKSDLTVAVNRALRSANIEIPFPQRDLHLRSVSGASLQALRDLPPK
ncbi:MAG: mechanosensitive ion channel [Polyangiaceae bacterium]|nr:mechanosensitive ion channel [Polyangiaceae bacterium]